MPLQTNSSVGKLYIKINSVNRTFVTMAKIKAILIDDEQRARSVLLSLLERTSDNIKILATCENLEDGVVKIKELQPDVVFLDVQMPNYAGYEIGDFFDIINFEIIFITAYDHYAIKAFELNAIDYLVKPVDRKKLDLALKKLENTLQLKKTATDYKDILNTIKNKTYQKIILPEIGDRRIINLNDIIAIEADGAYSKIYLINAKEITTSKNLKYFESILPKDIPFYRVHRAWIVNINYAKSLNKTSQIIILQPHNLEAKISRTQIEIFENKFNKPKLSNICP